MTNESNSNSSITKNDSQKKKKKSITKNKGVNFVPEVVPI